jgi:hypothetical protein
MLGSQSIALPITYQHHSPPLATLTAPTIRSSLDGSVDIVFGVITRQSIIKY